MFTDSVLFLIGAFVFVAMFVVVARYVYIKDGEREMSEEISEEMYSTLNEWILLQPSIVDDRPITIPVTYYDYDKIQERYENKIKNNRRVNLLNTIKEAREKNA